MEEQNGPVCQLTWRQERGRVRSRRPVPKHLGSFFSAVLVTLVSLAMLPRSDAACHVRLDLDAPGSPLVLGSTNLLVQVSDPTLSTASGAKFNATVPRGLSGILYAVSPTLAVCPNAADRDAWLASWPSFSLTSTSPSTTYSQPVAVYPALHLGKTVLAEYSPVPKFDYNISDMQINMTASGLSPTPGQRGNFTASWATQLTRAFLSSANTVTGSRYDSLQNQTSDVSGVAMSLDLQTIAGRRTLVVAVRLLQLTYQSVGRLTLFGELQDSYANTTLNATLTAKAILDCPSYCGDFGRCASVNSTASCVCDCGWSASGGQCAMPWGYCPASGGVLASALQLPGPPPPPPPTAPACPSANTNTSSVPSVNGACPAGYDWDPYGVLCNACPSGFSGSGCVLCSSDSSCKASLGSSTGQCLLSPLYRSRTAKKHYACQLKDPLVAGILGSEVDFTCSTTKPGLGSDLSDLAVGAGLVSSNSPVGASPFCRMAFRLTGMPRDASVVCTGWACNFTVGSGRVRCPVIKCECPKGCSNADGTITEATFVNLKGSVGIVCGSEGGLGATTTDGVTSCKIELGGLPIAAIPASCKTAECLDPVNGTITILTEGGDEKEPLALAPIIAWIPIMALFLVAATAAAAAASFVRATGPGKLGPQVVPGPVGEGQEEEDGADDAAAVAAAVLVVEPAAAVVEPAAAVVEPAAVVVEPAVAVVEPAAAVVEPAAACSQAPLGDQQLQRLPGQLATASQGTPHMSVSASAEQASCSSNGGGLTGSGWVGGGKEAVLGAAAAMEAGVANGGLEASVAEAAAAMGGGDKAVVRELSWQSLHLAMCPRRSPLPPWRQLPSVTLLHGVSGRAVSGQVLGIIGPSGSGKTTLLNVLAGLIQPGWHWRLSGSVALDGRVVSAPRHLAALVGHVPQHDLLGRSLTVAECVAAHAALRLSWRELRRGRQHVQSRVRSVLRELGIAHLAQRVVWPGGGVTLSSAGSTLSGGERLRVAAALELVSDPPLLLLDEPLSGLDSATARAMMAVLRSVAAGGRVVVASLHQPSLALFAALDSVCLMAGGRVAAAGPPGSLAAVVAAAGLPPPPPDVPLADHLLDLVVAENAKDVARLCDFHSASVAAAAVTAGSQPPQSLSLSSLDRGDGGGGRGGDGDVDYVRSLVRERSGGDGWRVRASRVWLELGVVTWRSGLDMLRNPFLAGLHLVVTGAIGLLVGAVFSGTDLNVSGAQNRVGALFFAVMLLACFATSAVDGIYPERANVDRDLLRRSYGVLPYMAAKLVMDGVLLRAAPAWAFGVPFYFLMGLRKQAAAFFTFLGAFTTMSCLAGATCIALSCAFSSPGATVLLLNLLLLICALFSGFLANKDSIVAWLRWIVYLSPIRFCWEALVINELKPLVLTFNTPDLPQGLPAVKGSLFLSLLGVDSGMLDTDLIVLGCMYGILAGMAAAFAALRVVGLRGRWR